MTNIKIFLDYACPFCYIGFSIADRLRKENPKIKFEYLPYELSPDASTEETNISNFIPEDKLKESYKRIEGLGEEYGLKYKNKTKRFNTHKLLLAGMYSKKEDKFHEFSREAFKAIFEDGKNVAKSVVINEIALNAGLNIVEMNSCIDSGDLEKELERAKNLIPVYEVDSVPTFIVNDRKNVTELKPYEEFKKDLIG